MSPVISGIHHVTAMAGDPQRNLDFYTGILGLRLVKLTVNFDDPGTYHFYFGDQYGRPGSILTFFPWGDNARQGNRGAGQQTATAFAIPRGSLGWWKEYLKQNWVKIEGSETRFGDEVLIFYDPDGLQLELVEADGLDGFAAWDGADVPTEHAIRAFHHVTLTERSRMTTAAVLVDVLGLREVGTEGRRIRYAAGDGGASALVDVLESPNAPAGRVSVGTVHHLAFRTATDQEQEEWQYRIDQAGYNITPVKDRQYFRSIYFREPGGVLFEIATDTPGFATDETVENLGTGLKLPSWLEVRRSDIERIVPELHLPTDSGKVVG